MTTNECIHGDGRSVYAKGMCKAHYERARTGISPNLPFGNHTSEVREWLSHLSSLETDGCIEWPFAKSKKGYAIVGPGYGARLVTHLALAMSGRSRPADHMIACHRCRSTSCVNERHLYWGTYQDNADDQRNDGTTNRGERNPQAVLVERSVLAIREQYETGASPTYLASVFGISLRCVWSVIRRETWKHV